MRTWLAVLMVAMLSGTAGAYSDTHDLINQKGTAGSDKWIAWSGTAMTDSGATKWGHYVLAAPTNGSMPITASCTGCSLPISIAGVSGSAGSLPVTTPANTPLSTSVVADSTAHGLYTATSTGAAICGIGFKRVTLTATLTGTNGSVTLYLDAADSTNAPDPTIATGWITLTANGVPMVVTGTGAGGIPPNSITTPGGYRWYKVRAENLNCTSVTWHLYETQ